jgi:tetratricopeptide (TPR) repeat protein
MKLLVAFSFFSLLSFPLTAAGQQSTQRSSGDCSPNISNTGSGTVTLQILGNACQGIDPSFVKQINVFLATYPQQQRRLNELLDKKDVELGEKLKEVADLTVKYQESVKQLEALGRPEHMARLVQMNASSDKDRESLSGTIRELEAVIAKTNFQLSPENLARLGWYCAGIAQYQKAIAFFLDATKQNPSLGSAYLGLAYASQMRGNEFLQRNDPDHAKEELDKAAGYVKIAQQYDELDAASLVQLGYTEKDLAQVFSEKGLPEKASEADENAARHFKMALGANPNDAGAHNGLGNVYFDKGDLDNAIKECQTATTLQPQYTFAWFDLVLALRRKYGSVGQSKDQNLETLRALLTALQTLIQLTQQENVQRLPQPAVQTTLELAQWATAEAAKYKQPNAEKQVSGVGSPRQTEAIETALDQPSTNVHIKVSGVGSPGQTEAIETALDQYDKYLRSVGVSVPDGSVHVQIMPAGDTHVSYPVGSNEVQPSPPGDTYVSYYDSSKETIYVNIKYADNTFWPLRDYTIRALLPNAGTQPPPSLVAILSGLATYYPSSSKNNPNFGPAYGGQLDKFRSLGDLRLENASEDGSSIWGSVCWELRTLLEREAADTLLLQAWHQMRPSDPAQPDPVRFASKIIELHKSSGGTKTEAIRLMFERRGIKL